MQRLLLSLLAVVAALLLLPCEAAPAPYREPPAAVHAAAPLTSRATSSPLDLVSQLSTCALSCLLTKSPEYGCSVMDIECQCENKPLYEALSACMVMNCTVEEAIGLAKVDAKQCDRPTDSKNGEFMRLYYAFSFLIYTPFFLRIVSRAFITKRLWWDDFFHFVAIVITFFITYCVGQPYIGQILWATSILALKVSVLCFYLHLFPDRKFQLACSIVLGVMVVGGTGFILFDVLQCMPVSAGWTLQHGEDAKCVKLSIVAISGASFNVLSEIAMFILPMPILSTLKLSKKKKIGVIILLGLGLITIIVSLVRIRFLMDVDGYADSTYRLYPGYLWTALEVVTAHFVVSAPAVSALFKALYGHVATTVRSSAYLGSRSSKSFKEKIGVSHDSSPPCPGKQPATGQPTTPMPMSPPRQGRSEFAIYGAYDFDDDDDEIELRQFQDKNDEIELRRSLDDDDKSDLRQSLSRYITASSSITPSSSVRASYGSTLSQVTSMENGPYVAR